MGSGSSHHKVSKYTPYWIEYSIALSDGSMNAYTMTESNKQLIGYNPQQDIYTWMLEHNLGLQGDNIQLLQYKGEYFGYSRVPNHDKLIIDYINEHRDNISVIVPKGTVIMTFHDNPYIYPLPNDITAISQETMDDRIFNCICDIFLIPTISRKNIPMDGILYKGYRMAFARDIVPVKNSTYTVYSYYIDNLWYSYPMPDKHMERKHQVKVLNVYAPYILHRNGELPVLQAMFPVIPPMAYSDIHIFYVN